MVIEVTTHETGDKVYHKGMKVNGVIEHINEDNSYEFRSACGTTIQATDADLMV